MKPQWLKTTFKITRNPTVMTHGTSSVSVELNTRSWYKNENSISLWSNACILHLGGWLQG